MTQVTVDAVSTAFAASNATSASGTHTSGGSTTCGAVIAYYGFNSRTISSVTWGGAAMSLGDGATVTGRSVAIYVLASPATGAQTIACNFSGAEYAHVFAISLANSDTTTAFVSGHKVNGTGTSISPSITCTSDTDELILDAMSHGNSVGTVDAGQTQRINGNAFGVYNYYASTQLGTNPNGVMSWSMGGSSTYASAAVSFKPAGGGAAAFIPIIGRGPGMALAGRGGLVAATERMMRAEVARAAMVNRQAARMRERISHVSR